MKQQRYDISTTMLAVALALVVLWSVAQAQTDAARIVIDTDCTASTVQAYGGDLGYPGPSQVTCEYDTYGAVINLKLRVFDERQSFVYLPMVRVGFE